MAILKYPQSFCKNLNGIVSNFWWGIKDKERKLHWISWSRASHPKSEGGMGFRDFRLFNLAYLAKQCWCMLQNPNSLWVKLVKGLYYPHSNMLQATPNRKGFWIWQSLQTGLEVLREGLRQNIGDGNNTLIWFDPWVPSTTNFKVPRLADCPL
ncbi:hypothetical protein P3X46_018692 [Hevea brasiliensis]|uniref:Reverse transcriptase zinc-binding domain-containing protein n=1 Tax=Hevea brasiliensis TaxID=3981 RepID=A0ABQ9LSU4_HEVBR|nr:hypothetical protein P3X46_018692 [Hevea brasiliensis]